MHVEKIRHIVEGRVFQTCITVVIVLNAIGIGLQTEYTEGVIADALEMFDAICLVIYIIEATLKVYAYRQQYFKDGWNIFDLTIILLSLLPTEILPVPPQIARIIRLFRIARVFRLVSAFRQLRVIVEAIGKSIPGVAWTSLLLAIFIYIFDVAGVFIFGGDYPEYFGNLGTGALTLFQIITLEGWPDIFHSIMETHPIAWVYFVPFIVISAFIMVNVVLGIILATIEESTQAERINQGDEFDIQLATELAELKSQVETVEYLLDKQRRMSK